MAELAVIGTLVSAVGSVAGGIAEKNAAEIEARQMIMQGKEDFAAGQREAFEQKREGDLAASALRARAAASGGGTNDATIVQLLRGIYGQSEYNAGATMYGAKSRQSGMVASAGARRRSGQAALMGSIFEGFGKTAGGVYDYGKSTGKWG